MLLITEPLLKSQNVQILFMKILKYFSKKLCDTLCYVGYLTKQSKFFISSFYCDKILVVIDNVLLGIKQDKRVFFTKLVINFKVQNTPQTPINFTLIDSILYGTMQIMALSEYPVSMLQCPRN